MGILDSGISWEDVDESQQGIAGPIPEGPTWLKVSRSLSDHKSLILHTVQEAGIDIQFSVVRPSHINRRIFETFVLNLKTKPPLVGSKHFMRGWY